MNRRPHESTSEEPDARIALTRELHEYLVAVLAEKFGDTLTVEEAEDPENGLVSYRFEIHGSVCSASLMPFNGTAAVLCFNGWLGRVYHNYAEALNWLGHNRAFNTVAVAHRESFAASGDLWVAANRNTLSGDIAGIRFELDDFCDELKKAIGGIRLWYPQFIDATGIGHLQSEENEGMAFALNSPREAFEAYERSEDARQSNPVLYCYVTRWLGEWEKNLQMNDSPQLRAIADETPALQAVLPMARLRALRALGRFEEVMAFLPSLSEEQLAGRMNAAIHAECLCGLGQDEEALESIQSAELDEQPWIHFIRCCACLKLGRIEEAAMHLAEYEARLGSDMMARRKVAELLPNDESEAHAE